jgi:hypothetical protein
MGLGGQGHDTAALPSGKRLGGTQSRSGKVRKILPGFDPRTVQPVASDYTD